MWSLRLTAPLALSCVGVLLSAGALAQGAVVIPPQTVEITVVRSPTGERVVVRLRLTIDAEGGVAEAEVVDAVDPAHGELARQALLSSRFQPATRDGAPVQARIVFAYVFEAESSAPPETLAEHVAPAAADPRPGPVADPQPEPPSDPEPSLGVAAEVEARPAERRLRSADAVDVIDLERARAEAADLGEVLARHQGATVRRSGGLGSPGELSLAGFRGQQVRVFLDGAPLELVGFPFGLANLPPSLVDRVEIYRGVVPSRFGADALGGAIDLITDQALGGTHGAASYQLGSFDTHRATLSLQHGDDATGLAIRASGFFDHAANDYPLHVQAADSRGRLGDVTVRRTNGDYLAGLGAIEVGFYDRPWANRLLLRAFHAEHERGVPHNVVMSIPYGEVRYRQTTSGATLRYVQPLVPELGLTLVAGYGARQIHFLDTGACAYDWFGRCARELPQRGETAARPIDQLVEQHAAFLRAQLEWRVHPEHALRLAIAPTFVTRSGEDRALGEGALDLLEGRRDLFDLVVGLEYQINAFHDVVENILFVKDYLQLAFADELLLSGAVHPLARESHRLGVGDALRVRLTRALWIKASYELATRLPTPDETFGDGGFTVANLALEPEASHNVNLGVNLHSPMSPWGMVRGEIAGFGRFAENLITLLNTATSYQYENLMSAECLGVLGSLVWTSPRELVELGANATWQDFRNTSEQGSFADVRGDRVPNQPHLFANAHARLQGRALLHSGDALSLQWTTRYVHEFFRGWESLGRRDSKQIIPSQLTHSVGVTYVSRHEHASLAATVEVQNLTGALVYDYFGVQRAGRSVFGKLTVQW